MTETTRQPESTAVRTLYVALELSHGKWRLAMTTDRHERSRHYTVAGGDVAAVLEKVARARGHWHLPADTQVVTCYEAGRDGFWLHRALLQHGVRNLVVDAASLARRNGRSKQVKTDRVDAERLLELLVDALERGRHLQVVHVPTVEEEDARHADRELASQKNLRTAIANRISSLLITQGIRASVHAGTQLDVAALRQWDGSPLLPGLCGRVQREVAAWEAVQARIVDLERSRRREIAEGATPLARQIKQLMQMRGVGANAASRLAREFYSWRDFQNGRQIGALSGLAPTPFASGTIARDQGISKAGVARVRWMAIEVSWGWLRFQPRSELTLWFQRRFGHGNRRQRRAGIVALARRLLIALWRFLTWGELPAGAELKRD